MDSIERLTKLFERFPGIGPRQAGRFVHYLLRSSPALRRELVESVRGLSEAAKQCPECSRYHSETQKVCKICANENRDNALLMIVASDADLASVENSGAYRGRYFVFGGTVVLGAEKNPHLRTKELLTSVQRHLATGLREIILAFPANPEGDATASWLHQEMIGLQNQSLKITMLGRGLSTGSELEYADSETLRSAFDNRK